MALLLWSLSTQAILLSPTDATSDGNVGNVYGPSNCEPDCINDLFLTSYQKDEELYKNDFVENAPGKESAYFSVSYTLNWNDPLDPTGGVLRWVLGTAYIVCGECYVAVKDGNHDPRCYFFDLSNLWNGQEELVFRNFWSQGGGAISHITIWGTPAIKVSEPGTLGLLGLGVLGLLAASCRRPPSEDLPSHPERPYRKHLGPTLLRPVSGLAFIFGLLGPQSRSVFHSGSFS